MSNGLTIKEMKILLEEIKLGCRYKSRKISDIENEKIKELISKSSKCILDANFTANAISALSTGAGAVAGTYIAVGTTATSVAASALVGSALTATFTAVATTEIVTIGASSLVTSTALGAAAGSVAPVIGTFIGAGVGAVIGITAGTIISKNAKNEMVALFNECVNMQTTVIRDLENEVADLVKKYEKACDLNERYKYIIGLITAHNALYDGLKGQVEK